MATVGEICSREAVVTTRDATVADAARLLRDHHVGSLMGIVAADDLMKVLAEYITALAAITTRERGREAAQRKPVSV